MPFLKLRGRWLRQEAGLDPRHPLHLEVRSDEGLVLEGTVGDGIPGAEVPALLGWAVWQH